MCQFRSDLDPKSGGHWSIHPADESKVSRRYLGNTNVLETTFLGATCQIVLTDFMPVTSEENKRCTLWPEHEVVRQIKCQQGEVKVVMEFSPRLEQYGPTVARQLEPPGFLGLRYGIRTPNIGSHRARDL